MADHPANIWLINENEFSEFIYTGGKIIYIAEDIQPELKNHPAIITAGGLLPPMEEIEAELDGNVIDARMIYDDYLQREIADPYISILIAAALQQVPIGIMFGKDELNMHFPQMLIDFLYEYYGLVVGLKFNRQPIILEAALPFDLAKLYMMNIIDYPTFMEKHPVSMPIHQMVIPRLAYDINPPVKDKNFENYYEYFENIKFIIHNKNKGRYFLDPLEGV